MQRGPEPPEEIKRRHTATSATAARDPLARRVPLADHLRALHGGDAASVRLAILHFLSDEPSSVHN